jgi:arylsulfatase A-like enzyme
MNRRQFVKLVGFGAALRLSEFGADALALSAKRPEKEIKLKPNFLFILADDLGWPQLGCYGSRFYETPNLDALAGEGMKFTDAYSAGPVCSPTRASIMTGKYPARLHITDFIPGSDFPYEKLNQPEWQKYLPLEEVTIAEVLKGAGYVTASFGKWHLSIAKKPPESAQYDPDKQGFDETVITEKPASKQDPEKDPHNVELITQKALDFLDRNSNKPFFLYVAHNVIHDPLIGKKVLVEKYKAKSGSDLPENNPTIAAMLEELDTSVGRLLKKLDELQIADKTVVIFVSDNGGLEKDANQTPLRSGKANLYEGGIRVPLIVRWPGVVKPGSICSEPVISVDFFTTFVDVLGLESKMPKQIDGVSIVPLLKGTGKLARRAIYWHYPHYHSAGIGPCGAVRSGDYKLIEWFDDTICGTDNRYELYNLKEDIGEKNDLSKKMPRKVDDLKKLLANWRNKVEAQMLTPNSNYNPQKAKKSQGQK